MSQALASDWLEGEEHPELRLQLLQVLSEVSLRAGHGALGAQELRKALRHTKTQRAQRAQLLSLLGGMRQGLGRW